MPNNVRIRGQELDISFDDGDLHIIRARTPVLTGLLVSRFVVDGEGRIVNDTPYGDIQERGNSKYEARFMVAKSIPEIGDRLVQRVLDKLDKIRLLNLKRIS